MAQSIVFVAFGGLRQGAVAALARRDAEHAAAEGASSTLVALGGGGDEVLPAAPVRVVRVDGLAGRVARRLRHGAGASGLARLVEALGSAGVLAGAVRRADVVVAHGGLEAAVVASLPGRARTVYRMHNVQSSVRGAGRSYPVGDRVVFWVADRWAVRRCDQVVAVSRGLADEVERATGRRPEVRLNGLPASPAVAGEAVEGRERDVDVLFVGRLVREKGVTLLPEFARQLARDERLVVAGAGVEGPALARATAADPRVELVGELDRAAVEALMRRARVVVVPSLHEPYGMVVVEAMAAGCSVVASDVGGIPEIVEHEVNGLLVAPGDVAAWSRAVRGLLDDRGRQAELAGEALRSAPGHREAATLPALHATYWGANAC